MIGGRAKALLSWVGLSLVAASCSSGSDPTSTVGLPPTTASVQSTTSAAGPTTTTSLPAGSELTVNIVAPPPLSTHVATIDVGDGTLAAPVRLTAEVQIPRGETVEVTWSSDIDGELGTGSVIDAELSNDRRDIVSHRITVTVTSSGGSEGSDSLDVIVRVPSN